jgi:hypothetical protein
MTTKIKKGDRFKITNGGYYHNKIGSVITVDRSDDECLLGFEKNCSWFYPDEMRRVSKKEYARYKNKIYYRNRKNKIAAMKLAQPLNNLVLK